MNTHRRLAIALLLFFGTADAASLKQAEFTRVINDVRLLQAQQQPLLAKIGDKIAGQTAVSTGVASRAELQFSDKTLTRIGSNSVFRLDKADRTVDLEKGVILLQVPKQIGGAKVRTAAVTAAVTGTTVMFEYDPVSGIIKIIVLEGQVDVYLNDNPSEMRTLVAGDILMMNVADRVIPMAAKIDLELLRKTSKLMDVADFGPLGNEKHLADALDEQGKLKQNGELLKTAFEIVGRGTQITLTNEARQEIFKTLVLQNRDPGAGGSNQGGNETPGGADGNQNGNGNGGNGTGGNATAGNGPAPQAPGSGTLPNQPILNSGTTVFGTGSSIVTNPHATAFNSLTNSIVTMWHDLQPGHRRLLQYLHVWRRADLSGGRHVPGQPRELVCFQRRLALHLRRHRGEHRARTAQCHPRRDRRRHLFQQNSLCRRGHQLHMDDSFLGGLAPHQFTPRLDHHGRWLLPLRHHRRSAGRRLLRLWPHVRRDLPHGRR